MPSCLLAFINSFEGLLHFFYLIRGFIFHVRNHENSEFIGWVNESIHIISKECIISPKFLQKALVWLSNFDGELW